MSIGERIQEARKKKKLTQKELAQKLGLSTGTIQQYELGKRQPRIEQLKEIATALDISIFELMGCFDEGDGLVSIPISDSIAEMAGLNELPVNSESPYYIGCVDQNSDFIKRLLEYTFGPSAQKRLLSAFEKLNIDGKEKAIERVEELAEIPKYQKTKKEGDSGAIDPKADN